MTRPISTFLSLFALVLGACATTPPVTGEACGAARAVLIPVISAVIEEGGAVELGVDTSLFPPASQTGRWDQIRDFGFAPVWRSAGTDEALRRAYWDAWREIDQRVRIDNPEAADLQAWEAAYDVVGDDRVFPDQRLLTRFLDRNQAGADFTCAADIASATGAVLVSADTPRAPWA